MIEKKKINVGIGFATGRKSFQKVLKTYVYNWRESGLTDKVDIKLNLFVAYDLKYSNTKSTDYTNVSKDVFSLIDDMFFIGGNEIQKESNELISNQVITEKESQLVFGRGYAGKRNSLLYAAMKNKMDCLVFFDDDEYPIAVTNTRTTAIWGGQQVLTTHLKHIENADITNGYHCGYISPIPFIQFNETMKESDFRTFIEAISNDIVNWDSINSVMKNGGVTYADTKVLISDEIEDVPEENHAKFITGANLCINLSDPTRVSPFYNPPGARGEDTFLSTCLSDKKVVRVPCYTFHDGFSTYNSLMDGVLPIKLKYIQADSDKICDRFYHACIGWVRYKPLLMYITQRDVYEDKITEMKEKLELTIPKVSAFFGRNDFSNVATELERYDRNVKKHYKNYMAIQEIWKKISEYLADKSAGQL